ncbi:c-type cytochrome [Aquabacterium sp. A7-Y]|uniref:c-type cytochrome n=1 Tax=Aquabacterium sp. A7-Y TaxID=1349605 RepID=UPI00223E49AF|nr:c-type cytochrome [Aquabacterium sp. A7-Y]MCW7540821.1 c-type cytochrome [Aquabacterium sp. A7-Y]
MPASRSRPVARRRATCRSLLSLLPWLAASAAFAAPPGAAAQQAVPDTIAQRVVACTTCHGKEGRATNQGYFPRIAGKPAGYLYHQLLNFRDGRRQYALMTYLVEHLSDDYLQEMAQYFASLDLPYPPPQTSAAAPGVLARGEALVRHGDAARGIPACVACHGSALTGVKPAIPGLLGLPRDYLNGQLGAWKAGQRRAHAPDCMAKIARDLAPEDIGAVSTWLSSQPLPADPHPAERLPAALPTPCGGVPN